MKASKSSMSRGLRRGLPPGRDVPVAWHAQGCEFEIGEAREDDGGRGGHAGVALGTVAALGVIEDRKAALFLCCELGAAAHAIVIPAAEGVEVLVRLLAERQGREHPADHPFLVVQDARAGQAEQGIEPGGIGHAAQASHHLAHVAVGHLLGALAVLARESGDVVSTAGQQFGGPGQAHPGSQAHERTTKQTARQGHRHTHRLHWKGRHLDQPV
jgi:hypothetical protein